jgi:methionyl-tRNA formyltransferase
MPFRAVFFGTPEFAVPSLAAMLDAGVDVPLVVTQPDRPAGRHAAPRPSPVARLAVSRDIPVARPERLRGNPEVLESLRQIAPDAGVVVAYGKLLPADLLDVPRLSFVNVHASLLPRHRGASPVQAAILAGDRETGVVTMKVVEELDAGPIYLERRVSIGEEEDAGSLSGRLALAGAQVLVETLRGLEEGALHPRPQRGEPSFCRPIRREQGEADWAAPAAVLERSLRAYTPWPGLFTFLRDERVKILAAGLGPGGRGEAPGTFWMEEGKLLAAAAEGTSLELRLLQREGRKPVRGPDFALGVKLPGRFGPAAGTRGS